jgi:hypothetical protein
MNRTTATVHDITLAQLRRKHQRNTQVESQPQATTIFNDMSDGILALDFGLTFAGFSYEARQFVHNIVGLLGDDETMLAMFDEELAQHVRCSDRTIRRWRAAHIAETKAKSFSFIEIIEGEYDADHKRYAPTQYKFACAQFIEDVVADARAAAEYGQDRQTAIEKAASEHYDEIPNAPTRLRRRKPKRSYGMDALRPYVNADKNLTKGEIIWTDMPDHLRAQLLAGGQREELLALVQQMKERLDRITDVLQDAPQTAHAKEVSDIQDNLSGIPSVSGMSEVRSAKMLGDVPEPMLEAESCVRDTSSYTRTSDEPSPDAVAAWERLEERVRAPQVQAVELELHGDAMDAPDVPDVPEIADPPEVELAERISIMVESGTPEPEAERLARIEFGLPSCGFSSATGWREGAAMREAASSPAFDTESGAKVR